MVSDGSQKPDTQRHGTGLHAILDGVLDQGLEQHTEHHAVRCLRLDLKAHLKVFFEADLLDVEVAA